MSGTLRDGARGATEGGRRASARRVLVASEFALAVMLLVGAGLMIRSFAATQSIDPGFDAGGVITASVSVTGTADAAPARRATFFTELVAAAAALPGVQSASAINHVPLIGDQWGMRVVAEDRPLAPGDEAPTATYRVVMPGYFRTMGIAVRQGRDVEAADRGGAPEVVVVNEALARELWPGRSPLGKRLTLDGPEEHPAARTVVGVVANVVQHDWTAGPEPEAYKPYKQSPEYLENPSGAFTAMSLVVRARCASRGDACDAAALAPSIRAAVRGTNANAPLSQLETMRQAVADATARPRFILFLLGAFAATAALLAAVGLYGVTAYSASRRTREIGVRVALGAARFDVLRLVAGEALAVVAVGVVAGTLGALALARLMRGLLYDVSAHDPLTFAAVPLLLGVVALLAAYGPSRRAARVDPLTALRAE